MAGAELPPIAAPTSWEIYKQLPSIVLGFHGCDRTTGEDVLSGRLAGLRPSENDHDWLGSGVYFWEADPWRALDWARGAARTPARTAGHVRDPFVIGAVIDLGKCCNLLDFDTLTEVAEAYEALAEIYRLVGIPMPANVGGLERLQRFRDRAVITHMHNLRMESGLPAYDTVRAAFIEGEELYEGSGFRRKNHIQIAVRDRKCIKGYFRLPDK